MKLGGTRQMQPQYREIKTQIKDDDRNRQRLMKKNKTKTSIKH